MSETSKVVGLALPEDVEYVGRCWQVVGILSLNSQSDCRTRAWCRQHASGQHCGLLFPGHAQGTPEHGTRHGIRALRMWHASCLCPPSLCMYFFPSEALIL